jgi:hypothetical protein
MGSVSSACWCPRNLGGRRSRWTESTEAVAPRTNDRDHHSRPFVWESRDDAARWRAVRERDYIGAGARDADGPMIEQKRGPAQLGPCCQVTTTFASGRPAPGEARTCGGTHLRRHALAEARTCGGTHLRRHALAEPRRCGVGLERFHCVTVYSQVPRSVAFLDGKATRTLALLHTPTVKTLSRGRNRVRRQP